MVLERPDLTSTQELLLKIVADDGDFYLEFPYNAKQRELDERELSR